MAKMELWMDAPEPHDYPAAADYLTMLMSPKKAVAVVARLKQVALVRRRAKDILRASALPVLPRDNLHVARDLKKIKAGKKLSPVLLVRGNLKTDTPLTIADGYHRICASWYVDENALIPCRLVSA